jgi:hypothetical protein
MRSLHPLDNFEQGYGTFPDLQYPKVRVCSDARDI